MSTRFSKTKTVPNSIDMGYEGTNVPEDFSIPSCTIEDVDRALFDLFNEDIPFFYQREGESRRVPVIFATGERFAILRRNRPLRDKSGVLILPLISMMRTSINQDVPQGTGPGQQVPLIIKKRLDKSDPLYQRLINKSNLQHQDGVASYNHFSKIVSGSSVARVKSGMVASRRLAAPPILAVQQGKLLTSQLSTKNIYEIITIPPIKYFAASYQVTFWSNYTQHMNELLAALMSAYQNMDRHTFRIETKKGYWFVAYVKADISSDSNFQDFTDSERIVRYSFNIEVPAYLVNPSFPGAPNALRSYTSAVDISFNVIDVKGEMVNVNVAGPPSNNPDKYVLQGITAEDGDLPGTELLGGDALAAVAASNSVNVGGAQAGRNFVKSFFLGTDPFTGKRYAVPPVVITSTVQGETTYKDLSTGKIESQFDGLIEIDV